MNWGKRAFLLEQGTFLFEQGSKLFEQGTFVLEQGTYIFEFCVSGKQKKEIDTNVFDLSRSCSKPKLSRPSDFGVKMNKGSNHGVPNQK